MRRGIGKIEILVILAVVAVVIAYIGVSLPQLNNYNQQDYDGTQLRGIHQSWMALGQEFGGTYPVPGEIKRKPIPIEGTETIVPGKGEIDESQNTTANLYSVCIMHNYFSPEICVGRTEPSGNVFVDDNYNWEFYDPGIGVHWDTSFTADLNGPKGSNVSYAHRPLYSPSQRQLWLNSGSQKIVILGNRGPQDGNDPDSNTYLIHQPDDQWSGNLIFNDHSVQMSKTMEHGTVEVDGQTIPDNFFRFDQGFEGSDNIITFTKDVTPEGPVVLWD